MANDAERYLHETLTASQSRYAYFLLAAAASAIALAVNRTAGEPLHLSQIPLGVAVLCWGASFYFGCRYLAYVQATIRANAAMVMAGNGTLRSVPPYPQYRELAEEALREIAEKNADRSGTYANRQFAYLVTGAVFFVAWHVLGMALRTPGLV